MKSARQFEIRKLSAQLWQLKDASTPAQGEKGRGATKARGGASQSADDAIQRLQDEIEGLKCLPFDGLLHTVRHTDLIPHVVVHQDARAKHVGSHEGVHACVTVSMLQGSRLHLSMEVEWFSLSNIVSSCPGAGQM